MSIIAVNEKQTQNYIEAGEKIIENNEFLKDISDLMENEQFNNFFNKYMSDWMDIKCSVTYMKLYDEFKKKYKKLNNSDLDKSIIIYLLTKIMKDKKLRPWSIKTVDNMLKEDAMLLLFGYYNLIEYDHLQAVFLRKSNAVDLAGYLPFLEFWI
jgi:hypothetical protein